MKIIVIMRGLILSDSVTETDKEKSEPVDPSKWAETS